MTILHAGVVVETRDKLQNDLCAPETLMAEDPLRWLRDATALVYVDGRFAGTAYLLDHDLAATCSHVLRGAERGARVELSFSWGAREAVVRAVELTQDIALLELTASADVAPFIWNDAAVPLDSEWSAVGYPHHTSDSTGKAESIVVKGNVRDAHARHDGGIAAIQLFCQDFAAGSGARPHGMSGSPVVIGGRLVGHLKRIITADDEPGPDGQRAQFGTVYATPIGHVLELSRVEVRDLRVSRITQEARMYPNPRRPYDPAYYVEREADHKAWRDVAHNAPIWLQSGWKMGATWFVAHLIERMKDAASKAGQTLVVALIDMEVLGITEKMDGDDIMKQVAFILAEELDCDPAKLMQSGHLVWQSRHKRWMEAEVLPKVQNKLVLVLDHFDVLAGHPFEQDICLMLRHWSDRVDDRHHWSKLQIILVSHFSLGTTTVGRSVGGSPVSAFPLPLGDWTPTEAAELARRYGLTVQAKDIEDNLYPLVGGHPLFLAVAFHAVATGIADWNQVLRDAESADGVFSDTLAKSVKWLRQFPEGQRALRDLLNHPTAVVPDEVGNRLCNIGVLVDQDRGFRFRYKIQETYFRRRLNVAGSPR